MSTCHAVRALIVGAIVLTLTGCGAATTATPGQTRTATPSPSVAEAPSPSPPESAAPSRSPRPTPRAEWPFVAAKCPDAAGEPWLVVALGGSDVAGWGLSTAESYSPQLSFAGQYADLVCQQEQVPIELHSFYGSQSGNELTPLSWWIDKVRLDQVLRNDLEAADVVVLTAMSAHDIVIAQFLPGACSGAWPDPLKICLQEKTARIPAQTDELFRLIAGLVDDDAIVLAGDTFAPPAAVAGPEWDEPYQDEIKRMVDPYFVVKESAPKYGFRLVDSEVVFNGESRREMPADGLFQSDGLHMTLAGHRLMAETYAEADGLGE